MRISDITFTRCTLGPVARPFYTGSGIRFSEKTFSFLEVTTDEGLTGFAPGGAAAAGSLEALKSRVVGEDPLNSARLWQRLFGGGARVVKGPDLAAIGAVDNALWDLRGKILGQPVYRLLGGYRDRVPVYASGGFYADGKDADELANECAGYVSLGYRAVKMRVGLPALSLREDVARVAAVREALGPGVSLMVDANSSWTTLSAAARFIRAVEPYELTWVEEPTWPDDLDGAADLCRTFDTPIAQGEREHTRWGNRELIDRRAVDVLQPDPEWCGGLTEFVRIAAHASAHHLPVAPHGTHLLGAHAAAAVDNGLTAEGCDEAFFPWHREFVEQYRMENGELVLPNAAGFGIELNRELIDRTRY